MYYHRNGWDEVVQGGLRRAPWREPKEMPCEMVRGVEKGKVYCMEECGREEECKIWGSISGRKRWSPIFKHCCEVHTRKKKGPLE